MIASRVALLRSAPRLWRPVIGADEARIGRPVLVAASRGLNTQPLRRSKRLALAPAQRVRGVAGRGR
jgi:hypothetical protein